VLKANKPTQRPTSGIARSLIPAPTSQNKMQKCGSGRGGGSEIGTTSAESAVAALRAYIAEGPDAVTKQAQMNSSSAAARRCGSVW